MPDRVVDGRDNLHPSRETYRSDRRWSTPTRTSYPPSVPRCSSSAVRARFLPTLSGFAASCSTASSSCRSSSTVSSIDRRARGRGVRVRAIRHRFLDLRLARRRLVSSRRRRRRRRVARRRLTRRSRKFKRTNARFFRTFPDQGLARHVFYTG